MKSLNTLIVLLSIVLPNSLFSQSNVDIALAEVNFKEKKYKEAVELYAKSINKISFVRSYYENYSEAYRNLMDYPKAIEVLETAYQISKDNLFLLRIAVLYSEIKDTKNSEYYLQSLVANEIKINYLTNNKIDIISKLIENQKFNHATQIIDAFLKVADNQNIAIMKGEIYAQQGNLENMIEYYISLIAKNRAVYDYPVKFKIYRLWFYSEINKESIISILKEKAISEQSTLAYLDVLCWIYNENDMYSESFVFCKSLYLRKYWSYMDFYSYGMKAFNAKKYEVSKKVFSLLDNDKENNYGDFNIKKMLLKSEFYTADRNNIQDLKEIDNKYKEIIQLFGIMEDLSDLITDYVYFLNYHMKNVDEAINILDKMINSKQLSARSKGRALITKGDILSYRGDFNNAILLYSKAEKLTKRTELEEEAKYKSAKASYYSGDFRWAKHKLNVFKTITTRLISNDALFLSILIHDNINDMEDSLKLALKRYSRAELLKENKQYEQAIEELNYLEKNYPNSSIVDEALFMRATIYESLGNDIETEKAYLEIIKRFPYEHTSESAMYNIALFYIKNKNMDKAKKYLEMLMFEKQGSIYIPEARELYQKKI